MTVSAPGQYWKILKGLQRIAPVVSSLLCRLYFPYNPFPSVEWVPGETLQSFKSRGFGAKIACKEKL